MAAKVLRQANPNTQQGGCTAAIPFPVSCVPAKWYGRQTLLDRQPSQKQVAFLLRGFRLGFTVLDCGYVNDMSEDFCGRERRSLRRKASGG